MATRTDPRNVARRRWLLGAVLALAAARLGFRSQPAGKKKKIVWIGHV